MRFETQRSAVPFAKPDYGKNLGAGMNRALPITPQPIIYLNGHDYSPVPGAEFFAVIKCASFL